MRKRQMTPIPLDLLSRNEGWLDLDREAVVETHRNRRIIQLNLRWSQEKCRAGVPPTLAVRLSG